MITFLLENCGLVIKTNQKILIKYSLVWLLKQNAIFQSLPKMVRLIKHQHDILSHGWRSGGGGGGKFMFGRTFSFEQHCPVFKKQTMFLEYLSKGMHLAQ